MSMITEHFFADILLSHGLMVWIRQVSGIRF